MDHSSQRTYRIIIPESNDDNFDCGEVEVQPSSASNKKMKKKIELLEEFGFDKDFERKAKSPKICVADFFGNEVNKKKFLQMAGYWQAYRKLKEDEKSVKYQPDRKMRKPGNPHLMDVDAKRRVIFDKQKEDLNHFLPTLRYTKSSQNSPKNSLFANIRRKGSDVKELKVPDRILCKSELGRNSCRNSHLEDIQRILDY